VYEVVAWSQGQNMGITIPAQKAHILVQKIMKNLVSGKNITIKFLIPLKSMGPENVPQNVIRPKQKTEARANLLVGNALKPARSAGYRRRRF